jgi:thiol-disulfide isomerase/thioredoxin
VHALRIAVLALALPLLAGGSAGAPPSALDASGAAVALAPAAGERAVLAHFWATWCPECVDELPLLARLAPRCASSGVRIVAVNVGESGERIERYLREHGLSLPVLRDPKGDTWRRLSARGLPTNAVWRPGAAPPTIDVGPRDAAAWQRALRELGCADSDP